MTDTSRKLIIPKDKLPSVNSNFNSYFLRYRVVSEDKNLFSEWSPIHEIPTNRIYSSGGSGNVDYSPSTKQITVTWPLQSNIFEYDVWYKWEDITPQFVNYQYRNSISNAILNSLNGQIKYTTSFITKNTYTINSISADGTFVTYSTTSSTAPLVIGDKITIANALTAGYNGIFTIHSITTNSIKVVNNTVGTSSAATANLNTDDTHSYNVGDIITVKGCTPTGFNVKDFIIEQIPDRKNFIITNRNLINQNITFVKSNPSTEEVYKENWVYAGRVNGNTITFYQQFPTQTVFSVRVYVPHYPIIHDSNYLIFAYLDRIT